MTIFTDRVMSVPPFKARVPALFHSMAYERREILTSLNAE
jgi:hypothetical protein